MAIYARQIDFLLDGVTDDNGDVLDGGLVYVWDAGTSTLSTLYQDRDKLVAQTNPVVLDSEGRGVAFADGAVKIEVRTSEDANVWGPVDGLEYRTSAGDNNYQILASDYGDTLTQATLQAAVTAINLMSPNTRRLVLDTGDWEMSSNFTFPANIEVDMPNGARLDIPSASTKVTFAGAPPNAGDYEIFTGNGITSTLNGIKFSNKVTIRYEWWDSTVSSPYIRLNATFNALTAGGRVLLGTDITATGPIFVTNSDIELVGVGSPLLDGSGVAEGYVPLTISGSNFRYRGIQFNDFEMINEGSSTDESNFFVKSKAKPTKGTYKAGDVIFNPTPAAGEASHYLITTDGGLVSGTRANTTAYNAGDWVQWSTGTTVWEAVVAGTTAGSPPSIGGATWGFSVEDGTVTWEYRAADVATALESAKLGDKIYPNDGSTTEYIDWDSGNSWFDFSDSALFRNQDLDSYAILGYHVLADEMSFGFYEDSGGDMDLRMTDGNGTTTVLLDTDGDSYLDGGSLAVGTNAVTAPLGSTAVQVHDINGAELVIGGRTTNFANAFIGGIAFHNDDTSSAGSPHYAGIAARAEGSGSEMSLRFYTGYDNYESNSPQMSLMSTGRLGLGESSTAASPPALLSLMAEDSATDGSSGLLISQAGAGDATLRFQVEGGNDWCVGLDNSDSDRFKIGTTIGWSSGVALAIDQDGQVGFGGVATPAGQVEILASSGAQLVLSQAEGSAQCSATVNASGELALSATGGVFTFNGALYPENIIVGDTSQVTVRQTLYGTTVSDTTIGTTTGYANNTQFTTITSHVVDATSSSEDGSLRFSAITAGTPTEYLRLQEDTISTSKTLDLGTNTIYDGNMTGDWEFNQGILDGVRKLTIDDNTASEDVELVFEGLDGVTPRTATIKLDVDLDRLDVNNDMYLTGTFISTSYTYGNHLWISDSITPPGATSGATKIYKDSGDGRLKAVFGNGDIELLGVGPQVKGNSGAVGISDDSEENITFTSADSYDNDSMHNPASNSDRFYATEAGVYTISVNLEQSTSNTTGYRWLRIKRYNSSDVYQNNVAEILTDTSYGQPRYSISGTEYFDAGDYAVISVRHTGGVSLNFGGTFTMTKVN